tara:strand:- start:43114 stop:43476 length:363 start_codon:yes stop_codon:yes gene_type:complete
MNNNLIKRYAVLWLNSQGDDMDTISESLDIPKASIKRIVKLYADTTPEKQEEKQEEKSSSTASTRQTAKDFMINQTSGKGSSGVTIMTKTASERNDASKKNSQNKDQKFSNCIYKLDENK